MPLVAFTPHVAAASLVVAGVAFALRRPLPGALALAGAAALAACVLPRALDGAGAHEGVPLRVLTANMKLGTADPDALVGLVRSQEVDVLSVQELTSGLARRLEAAGLRQELPHQVLAAGPQSSGGGIYSRLPLSALSRLPSSLAHPLPGARFQVPGAENAVDIYSFHPPPPVSGAAVAEWSSDLRSLPDPPRGSLTVVAGDFNATLDHSELRDVLDRGYRDAADEGGVGLQPTWPTGRVLPPQVAIDHVLVDERARIAGASIHDLRGSDHRAVLAEVRLRGR